MLAFVSASARQGGPHDGQGSNGYVGSESCSSCHNDIYRHYMQSGMGRSMLHITPSVATPAFLRSLSIPSHSFDERKDRHFDTFMRDGKLFQSESQTAADGTDIFRDTHEIEWMIGAGINGFGAIVRRDDYLFQAPQSFYSKPRIWGPSPGYEQIDLGFNRPIQAGCIFCHSGRPNPIADTNGQFASSPFSEIAIGCENCHGPGAEHIATMKSAGAANITSLHIVNPARLSPYLSDNICMACHQTGDVRVLKPGKTYQDFRPGEALDNTLSILMVPPTRSAPPDADHVEHYYSMTLSKCYRESRGRLSCITCHDPHVEPAHEEAPAYFNGKCLSCHTERSCRLPLNARQQTRPADNCIGCHMPKRDIGVISHSSATNHRIVARSDEPFPEITFQQTLPSLPDLLHLNPTPGQENALPPLLTLLEAYGELAANRSEYVAPYLKVLGQLEQSQPENALVQAALGRRELKKGNLQAAVDHLRHALQLEPQATTFADLSEALSKLNQIEESLPPLERASQMDPFDPVIQKTLVVRLIQLKQYARAQTALEHYLQVFPQDSFMREMLARAKGASTR
ncbi:hypothetical protein H7849_23105 [Alloacidobacterium dinghuense]|uniref:Tetratricopeptide repeat protein n=1 Tax=Alloacidobacterium dinghuense TaxID=2763107 RepID=A0A7G8BH65_9BACT|nr:cytochrome c3 family protein [Alloacidobacterium dinghuense]QNI31885.1 hypothetical protein H7849_23105 [Alloacidobacterium dinghuense]